MTSEDSKGQPKDESSSWSASAMFIWGTFGHRPPSERRFIFRSCMAGALAVLWVLIVFATHFRPKPALLIGVFLPGLVASYIVWEWRKYFLSLDELTRRVQL